jgi:hypothetical protein
MATSFDRLGTSKVGGTSPTQNGKRAQYIAALQRRWAGWRNSHACTTSGLHGFLGGAYTDQDSQRQARIARIRVSWRYDSAKTVREH